MDLDNIDEGFITQPHASQKHMAEEVEKLDVDLDVSKEGREPVNLEEEKRLIRKLDRW